MLVTIDQEFDEKLTLLFAQFCCEELKVFPSKIEIACAELDDKSGVCIDIEEDEFLIIVDKRNKSLSQIYATIAHELVHVEQYMYKALGNILDKNRDVKYEDRWWEKEAKQKSIDLVQKFVDIYFEMS